LKIDSKRNIFDIEL